MAKKSDRKVSSPVEKERPKPVVAMVPLFSQRSMIILAIGLVVGIGLGIIYYIISPSLSSSIESDNIPEPGGSATGPWKSEVNIQVVNQGSSYLSTGTMQGAIISYAAKANSLSFLEFLSQELAHQVPQYRHTVNELARMISIRYNSSGLPIYNFKLIVTAPTVEETMFLVTHIPEVFKDYLIAEEGNNIQQEQQDIQQAIEAVKTELLKAKQELSALTPQGVEDDINNNPTYIALNAKVKALESALTHQASELSLLIATDNVSEFENIQQQEYENTLQQVRNISAALTEAQQELKVLELKRSDIYQNATYIALTARINGLQAELERQINGWVEMNPDGTQNRKTGLAEMIAKGDTTSVTYKERLKNVEIASAALADAKKQVALLQIESSQNSTPEDLDYQAAKTKVENLNTELSAWKEGLAQLVRESVYGYSQQNAQAAFERTSAALAEAQKELDTLTGQFSDAHLAQYLDYELAKNKVENLNRGLASLNDELNSSLRNNINLSAVSDYLTVGSPSIPEPAPPVKLPTAMLVGIVIGMGGAWVTLNFRWLIKGMPSLGTGVPKSNKEDKEVEA